MNVARIALLVACSAVLQPSAARAQSDLNAAWTWTSIGPASATSVFGYKVSGRVSSIAVKQDGSILIAAANGGIWQRNGGRWTNLSPDLPTLSFGAVAFAPSVPDMIYAGSGENHECGDCLDGVGVFKKTAGSDWRLLPDSPVQRTSVIAVDATDPDRVWVGGSRGAFLSTNGEAFDVKRAGRVTDLEVDPTDRKIVFVADEQGVSRSTDGGEHFSDPENKQIRARDKVDHSAERYNIALAMSPSNHKVLYASYASASGDAEGCLLGIIKTDDGGDSWKRLTGISIAQNDYFESVFTFGITESYCQGTFDNALAVSPDDEDVVVAGGIALIRTMDGGKNWDRLDRDANGDSVLHEDHHALAYQSGDVLLDGSDGGVFSVAADGSVTDLNDGLEITEFTRGASAFNGGQDIVAGTQDNGTLMISDALTPASAHRWTMVLEGDGGYTATSAGTRGDFYLEYIRGDLHHKGPADQRPRDLNPGLSGAAFYMPFVARADAFAEIYAAASELYLNDGSGLSRWQPLSSRKTTASVSSFALSPSVPRDALLGWSDSEIMALEGGTLHTKTHPWESDSGAVDDVLRESATTVYVVVAGHVWRTVNFDRGDPAWTDVTGDLPCAATVVKRAAPGILSGCEDGAFVLNETSGAPVWRRFGAQLPHVPVVDIVALGDRTLLALTHGRGAWIARLPQP